MDLSNPQFTISPSWPTTLYRLFCVNQGVKVFLAGPLTNNMRGKHKNSHQESFDMCSGGDSAPGAIWLTFRFLGFRGRSELGKMCAAKT
jgi:hypothetical protein